MYKKPPNIILLDVAASFLTWPNYEVIILMAIQIILDYTGFFSILNIFDL